MTDKQVAAFLRALVAATEKNQVNVTIKERKK